MNQDCSEQIFQNGATWLRADFHLHTRKDKEFKYDGAENAFVTDYVAALERANIRLGVITNHNKFDADEFKALRKKARSKEILLLPGVELSVDDGKNGIHVLVVFSDDWLKDCNHINPFLSAAFQGKAPVQYENENGRCNYSLLEALNKLEDCGRDFFIAFAHVEQPGGLWEAIEGGRMQELGVKPIFRKYTLGFQKVRSREHCQKVHNWLADWYPAEIEGSDPKSIEEIGRGPATFLKLGAFTFDAVKFALADHANRVAAGEAPRPAHSRIESVRFEGGLLDGQTIHFAAGLNTLIGVRGSGKSAILESLRYALDIPFGDKASDRKYKEELPGYLLGSGGKVTLNAIDRHGYRYEIRRIYGERPDIFAHGELQPGVSIRETVIRKPIYFGQKDLANTGEGFERDLVEKLLGEKLFDVRRHIQAQKLRALEAIRQWRSLTQVEEQKRDREGKQRNAEFRLRLYQERGLEDKLQDQLAFDADLRKCTQVIDGAQRALTEAESALRLYEDDLRSQQNYRSSSRAAFFQGFFDTYNRLLGQFDAARGALAKGREVLRELETQQQSLTAQRDQLKEEFARIERQLAAQLKAEGAETIRPDEFRSLRNLVEQLKQEIAELDKQVSRRDAASQAVWEAVAALNDQWQAEFDLIQAELARTNQQQSALVIHCEFKGDKPAMLTFLKEIMRGSRLREDTLKSLVDSAADFNVLHQDMERVKSALGNSAAMFEDYFTRNLEAMLTWQPPNRFTLEYHGKELKQHSIGQRASALMLFILSQQAGDLSQQASDVVIIDQPEDDLDNQTIYEDVIRLICALKPRTQFIFATHNPNLPVLGDAEQVLVCSYSSDRIAPEQGSIDCPKTQAAIVNIMEGGVEAFSRRKRIYETWTSSNS